MRLFNVMLLSVVPLLAVQISGGSQCPVLPPEFRIAPVMVGWHDELNRPKTWGALAIDNKAKVSQPKKGALQLNLDHVPEGWPYSYQWSGVTRDAKVDLARFPVLMARVEDVHGYAHLDIEVLNLKQQPVKTLRSTTVTEPGLVSIDLSKDLDPARYTLRLRLIVGGQNEGCSATYDWVRFVSQEDATLLEGNPDYQKIVEYR